MTKNWGWPILVCLSKLLLIGIGWPIVEKAFTDGRTNWEEKGLDLEMGICDKMGWIYFREINGRKHWLQPFKRFIPKHFHKMVKKIRALALAWKRASIRKDFIRENGWPAGFD